MSTFTTIVDHLDEHPETTWPTLQAITGATDQRLNQVLWNLAHLGIATKVGRKNRSGDHRVIRLTALGRQWIDAGRPYIEMPDLTTSHRRGA